MTSTRLTSRLTGLCGDDAGRCLRLAAAFAAVYLIWGSTYLAIRVAIETIPPFVMAGGRFLLAGAILFIWSAARGTPRPTRAQWMGALIVGGLLLAGGNGAVTWSEQEVPSGLAALVVATIPIWMVLLDALRPGGTRPNRFTLLGVAIGFLGIVLLFGPADLRETHGIRPISMIVLFFAPLSWAIGSLYSRGAPKPHAPLQGIGMQMLCGGALLLIAATLTGQWAEFDAGGVSLASAASLLYLIFFGSIVAYSAYIWLLTATTPAKVSTYAYVNPIIAVFLGWAIADEPVTLSMLAAMAIILFSVTLISGVADRRRTVATD
ncbi:MAG: drug/metabolite exporter YedA [Caldilineales bacterium]